MSTIPFNNKKQQLQFINCCIGIHDLNCTCNNPGFHTLKLLAQQIGPELNQQDKNTIKKCLGGDEDGKPADVDGIDFGDLEKLFEEDDTEDAG